MLLNFLLDTRPSVLGEVQNSQQEGPPSAATSALCEPRQSMLNISFQRDFMWHDLSPFSDLKLLFPLFHLLLITWDRQTEFVSIMKSQRPSLHVVKLLSLLLEDFLKDSKAPIRYLNTIKYIKKCPGFQSAFFSKKTEQLQTKVKKL